MRIVKKVGVDVGKPAEAVFDFAADPGNFPRYVLQKGIIPGVTQVVQVDEGRIGPGSRRRLTMTDKSEMIEEIVSIERPLRFVYRWASRPKPPFCWLVAAATATWTFTPRPGGTRVEWEYVFDLTSFLAAPAAALVLIAFEAWMKAAMEGIESAMGQSPSREA